MKRPYRVGLTGGVGSGKSTVARILADRGVPVVDADTIAREVVEPCAPAYREVVEAFGPGILREDGTLDRGALGRMVFSDPALRRRLEGITHPHILRRMSGEIDRLGDRGCELVVLDIPLLFEVGLEDMCDEVWVVWATKEHRSERVASRDGLDGDEVERRMGAQMPLEDKVGRADVVIDNDGSLEDTSERARRLLDAALRRARDRC